MIAIAVIIGASALLGINTSALVAWILDGLEYPEYTKALSCIALAIALLGLAF
jgi:hypothetical protein